MYAPSRGLRALVQDGVIAWVEGTADHDPPRRLYPRAILVMVHEPPTAGRVWRIGDRWPGEMT